MPAKLNRLSSTIPNHYATLGLDRRCTETQIRQAYRLLAKQHHPDVNHSSREALAQTQALNAAYEILSDPERRLAYDVELDAKPSATHKSAPSASAGKATVNTAKEIQLSLADLFRGTKFEVRVNDPSNPHGPETYELIVPPLTAVGTRFKIPRGEPFERGFVLVRVKARPDLRFKIRGTDLRCDLKINFQRATQGGTESVRGVTGNFLRVNIPKKVARGEILTIAGEGLPKPRGGRGDLLVRILYQPEVKIIRKTR